MRESALSFVIEVPGLSELPYCLQAMRERGLPPHLTVLYPWVPAPLTAESVEAAARAVAGTGAIELVFDRLGTFPGGVVHAAVADPDAVVELMGRVWSAFPDTPPYRGEFSDPVPHLTLAKCAPHELAETLAEIEEQTATLVPFSVTLTELGVLEQGENGRWSVVNGVPLT